MEIVINRCYGGFSISEAAKEALNIDEDGYIKNTNIDCYDDKFRTYPPLINLIKEKGVDFVNGSYANLKIVEIPDGIKYQITDYDGMEMIEEVHRCWY